MRNIWEILFLFLFLSSIPWAESLCSSIRNIDPCKCKEHEATPDKVETHVECWELKSDKELLSVAERVQNLAVTSISFFNSDVGYLPTKLFHQTRVNRIQIYDTVIGNFSDGSETSFTGLEKYLEELVMRRCGLTEFHHFSMLETLSVLGMLDLSYNRISEVPADWFRIPPRKLREVYLKGNQISRVEERAFATVTNLRVLDLSENRIVSLERNVLPVPASHLEYLYLSYNELESLPTDFFHNMTILDYLYLDHNHLSVIPSATMETLWKTRGSLSHVDLLGNDIICNVTLCWLAFYENENLTGSCAEPDLLRGRRLRSLWPWDLECRDSLYKGDTQLGYRPKL